MALDDDILVRMRTQVISALWKGRSSRVPDILMSLIFPGHRWDPVQVVAYRALWTLRNICLKYPQISLTASQNWSLHLQAPGNNIWGPIHTAFPLKLLDGHGSLILIHLSLQMIIPFSG